MSAINYWRDCIADALEECGANLAPEQIDTIAEAVKGAHEHYDQAFYQPPASDRFAELEREHKAALKRVEDRLKQTEDAAERALKASLKLRDDIQLSFNSEGEVFRHGGRTEQIV